MHGKFVFPVEKTVKYRIKSNDDRSWSLCKLEMNGAVGREYCIVSGSFLELQDIKVKLERLDRKNHDEYVTIPLSPYITWQGLRSEVPDELKGLLK